MKKSSVIEGANETTNEIVSALINSAPEIRFISKIDDALRARNLTQAKLAILTGLRTSTISELVNGSRTAMTKTHAAVVMIALRITDIRELFDIEFSPETVEKFNVESNQWIEDNIIPEEVRRIYTKHSKKMFTHDIR